MKALPVLISMLRIVSILAVILAPLSVHGMFLAPSGGGGSSVTQYYPIGIMIQGNITSGNIDENFSILSLWNGTGFWDYWSAYETIDGGLLANVSSNWSVFISTNNLSLNLEDINLLENFASIELNNNKNSTFGYFTLPQTVFNLSGPSSNITINSWSNSTDPATIFVLYSPQAGMIITSIVDANVKSTSYTAGYFTPVSVYGAGEAYAFQVGEDVNYQQLLKTLKSSILRLDAADAVTPMEAYGIINSVIENTPGTTYVASKVINIEPTQINVPPEYALFPEDAQDYATTVLRANLANDLTQALDQEIPGTSLSDITFTVKNINAFNIGGTTDESDQFYLNMHSKGDTVIDAILKEDQLD